MLLLPTAANRNNVNFWLPASGVKPPSPYGMMSKLVNCSRAADKTKLCYIFSQRFSTRQIKVTTQVGLGSYVRRFLDDHNHLIQLPNQGPLHRGTSVLFHVHKYVFIPGALSVELFFLFMSYIRGHLQAQHQVLIPLCRPVV